MGNKSAEIFLTNIIQMPISTSLIKKYSHNPDQCIGYQNYY
jgi:hypothetical protein